jgi:mono/diheme cytochrome c family protein
MCADVSRKTVSAIVGGKMSRSLTAYLSLLAILLAAVALRPTPAAAGTIRADEDPVTRGKYLATIAGCIDCHSPLDEKGAPDFNRAFSGGQPFDLGPLGTVFSKNLTSDKETGLGNWTDDEIKTAMRTGISRDGLHLFPIMPYAYFNQMADADVDAIVAYLRTLPPVVNKVPRVQILPVDQMPKFTMPDKPIIAPDVKDVAARGQYLMHTTTECSDCHTPIDANTGAPIMDRYLSGGQPYVGPWGTVYGGNITPDPETGIAKWSDDQIKRVLREGVLKDGRRAVLMPWRIYKTLNDDDLDAILYFLRHDVKPVVNKVPDAALTPGFIEQVDQPATQNGPDIATIAAALAVVILVLGVGAFLYLRSQSRAKPRQPGAPGTPGSQS